MNARVTTSTAGRGAAATLARVGGLITVSLLAGGCSAGSSGATASAPAALRPELHEVAPNADPDCIALVTRDPVAPPAGADAEAAASPAAGCTDCACDAGDRVAIDMPRELAPVVEDGDADAAPPEAQLQRLMDGNKRFAEGEAENIERWPQRPADAAAAAPRRPAAMVLACSDWALLPEAAFDAEAGELFVVRVAGNVADAAVIESARYAVQRYEIPLIVVLGHENCGAVHAAIVDDEAMEGRRANGPVPAGEERAQAAHDAEGRFPELAGADEAGPMDGAVEANVEEVVDHLRAADPELTRLVADGKLKIVGAVYDARNGLVTLQPETPATEVAETPRD